MYYSIDLRVQFVDEIDPLKRFEIPVVLYNRRFSLFCVKITELFYELS